MSNLSMRAQASNDQAARSRLYLILVLGACFGLGVAALFTRHDGGNAVFNLLQKGFTFFPVLAAVFTRLLTKDHSPWYLNLKVWKNPALWAFCALVPGACIAIGATLYFLIFPAEYSGSFAVSAMMEMLGVSGVTNLEIASPIVFAIVTVLLSAAVIPLQLFELGEEIGWRGYLLPLQIKRWGVKKAVLINSFWWGMAHLPLIYFGFNYSLKNPGAPWSNMLAMLLVCMVLGVIESYVTIRSGNCMFAAVIHGAVNFIGEVPVFLSTSLQNTLLGPNPTGVIGISGLMALAIWLFFRLDKIENHLTAY